MDETPKITHKLYCSYTPIRKQKSRTPIRERNIEPKHL